MSTITIDCPDIILRSMHETKEQFADELRLMAAVKLYEIGKLSSSRAADLAGISRVSFFHKLATFGVALYSGSQNDLANDLLMAREASNDYK